ncbi:hypothetical protein Curi_c21950 [Gottschalkia acidurici 9a]|uniref:Uncharacterized protein n=2 Tax=Clostridium acidurici TaxID=1556 RepID=K0AZH4_GOTA9|nr:hypothetical protein Curi_c21950 [Gottschalkia acidurici 9a]
MVDKLLYEYKQIFSFNKRYFRYFHKWKVLLTFFIILALWSLMYVLIKFYNITIHEFIKPLPLLLVMHTLYRETNRVVKDVHKMSSAKDYNEKCKSLFQDRVKMNKIDVNNKEQMDMLLKIIDSEIKELKPNFILNRGIIAGLFAPLWICYIESIYNTEVQNVQDATYLFLTFSVLLIELLIIGYQLKQFIYDDIISDYGKLKRMSNLLKEAYLISLNSNLAKIE